MEVHYRRSYLATGLFLSCGLAVLWLESLSFQIFGHKSPLIRHSLIFPQVIIKPANGSFYIRAARWHHRHLGSRSISRMRLPDDSNIQGV